tara:strand:- start:16 stop:468 length:453 start_codon:yes stop_codon:yes gene_type:complete
MNKNQKQKNERRLKMKKSNMKLGYNSIPDQTTKVYYTIKRTDDSRSKIRRCYGRHTHFLGYRPGNYGSYDNAKKALNTILAKYGDDGKFLIVQHEEIKKVAYYGNDDTEMIDLLNPDTGDSFQSDWFESRRVGNEKNELTMDDMWADDPL